MGIEVQKESIRRYDEEFNEKDYSNSTHPILNLD